MQLGEGTLEDRHEEDGRAARDVAGALRDRVRGDHARPRVALGRAERDAGPQRAGRVDERGSFGGEHARVLAGAQHGREHVAQTPRDPVADEGLVLVEVGLDVGARRRVNREQARGVADAQDVPTRQPIVDPAGQRRQACDARRVFLGVEDRLVQVGDRPTQGNVEAEESGQLVGRASRVRVAPRAEGSEQAIVRVEGEVAVHHRGDTDRAVGRGGDVVAFTHVGDQGRVGALQAGENLVEAVGPQAALQVVLPPVAAGCEHLVVGADEDGFDAGRTEFDAESGVGGGDDGAGVGAHGCSLGLH